MNEILIGPSWNRSFIQTSASQDQVRAVVPAHMGAYKRTHGPFRNKFQIFENLFLETGPETSRSSGQ